MNSNFEGFITYNCLIKTEIDEFLKSKFKEHGHEELKPSYSKILDLLYRNNNKIQIKCIYECLSNQKSTITEMINRLVKLGYLQKVSCPNDRRVSYVIATEKAISFKDDFNKISQELLNKVFSNFSDSQKEDLTKLIKKIVNNFN